jgi:hypothetical protein
MRFKKFNPHGDVDEVIFEDYWSDDLEYDEYILDLENEYPQFEWRPLAEKYGDVAEEPLWSTKNYYPIKLKLYRTGNQLHVRGTIKQHDRKWLEGVGIPQNSNPNNRLPEEWSIHLPIEPKPEVEEWSDDEMQAKYDEDHSELANQDNPDPDEERVQGEEECPRDEPDRGYDGDASLNNSYPQVDPKPNIPFEPPADDKHDSGLPPREKENPP